MQLTVFARHFISAIWTIDPTIATLALTNTSTVSTPVLSFGVATWLVFLVSYLVAVSTLWTFGQNTKRNSSAVKSNWSNFNSFFFPEYWTKSTNTKSKTNLVLCLITGQTQCYPGSRRLHDIQWSLKVKIQVCMVHVCNWTTWVKEDGV